MIGFDRVQRQQIEGVAQVLPYLTANWRPSAVAQADAWLVCGERTRALPFLSTGCHGSLLILAGLPCERAVTLNLNQIDRPLAFSVPLNSPDTEPRFTFELGSPNSLKSVLQHFEQCLSLMRSQFILGKYLVEHETQFKAVVHHVIYKSKLLAVMDFVSWRIGMLADADPSHFEQAVWEKRPEEAKDIPTNFFRTSVAELRWIYARHSARNLLPARYRHELIYHRQPPQVALAWLSESHLLLLHKLSKSPATLQNLIESTGLSDEQLACDLACLYFAGSLTTTQTKAAKIGTQEKRRRSGYGRTGFKNLVNIFNSTLHDNDDLFPEHDTTVSARIRPE